MLFQVNCDAIFLVLVWGFVRRDFVRRGGDFFRDGYAKFDGG